MTKYTKFTVLALTVIGVGISILGAKNSIAQSTDSDLIIKKHNAPKNSDVFDPDSYVGEIVTVIRGGEQNIDEKLYRGGYLESKTSDKFYCYENRVKIIQKTTQQGDERKTLELNVFLNNEGMSKFIPSEFQSHLQKFHDLEFSFSCEKEAVWVLAEGVSASSENYEPRSFVFSFFAVPESRNLQKLSMK